MTFDPGNWVPNIFTVTVPILLYMWSNREKAREDVQKRHKENQELLTQIATEKKYYPLHNHTENSGPLNVEGIDYPPNGK